QLALQYDSKTWSTHASFSNTGQDLTVDWQYDRTNEIGSFGWRLNLPTITDGDWVFDDNGYHIGQTPYIIELPGGGKTSVAYNLSATVDSEDGASVSLTGGNTLRQKDGTIIDFYAGKMQDTNGNFITFTG